MVTSSIHWHRNPADGVLVTKQELKGLDIVRRDWCKLSVEVGKAVVTMILEGEMSQEDLVAAVHGYLQAVGENVVAGKVGLDQFVITKALTRNPENYANTQGQPHVQVALRLNASGGVGKEFRAKDTVEYVICNDGTTNNPAQRAYSPGEVLNSSSESSRCAWGFCEAWGLGALLVLAMVMRYSCVTPHIGWDDNDRRSDTIHIVCLTMTRFTFGPHPNPITVISKILIIVGLVRRSISNLFIYTSC